MHAEVVFIDTNLFVQLHFDFTHPTLKAVCDAGEGGDIGLVTTEVTDWEIRRHMERDVRAALAAVRKQRVLNNVGQPFLNEEEVVKKCLGGYEGFLTSTDTKLWTISPGASRTALDLYLEQEPPFTGSKKHKEFPDAYVISTIKEYLAPGGRSIIVCTQDNGFAEACEGVAGTKTLKSLKDLLEHVAKRKEAHYALLLAEANTIIERERIEIERRIKDDVKEINFSISDFYADIEDAVAGSVEFHNDTSIIYVTRDELSAQFSFDADYIVSVSGRQVVRDPVDGDDVDIGSKSAPDKSGTVTGTVTLTFDRHDDSLSLLEIEVDLPREETIEVDDDDWAYDE